MSIPLYREYLADTYALAYLHTPEIRDLLVLILSKFTIRVSQLTIVEFLAYLYYKHRDTSILEKATNLIYKLYTVESLERDFVLKASTIMSDLVSRGEDFDLVELFNAAIATLRNIPILTDDPSRYSKYTRYNVTAVPVDEFVEQFKLTIGFKSSGHRA